MKGFVFRLLPPRPDFASSMTDDERSTMLAHVAYWSRLAEEGRTLAFGPVDDPNGQYGIGIVLAEDIAAAAALRDDDPALRAAHGFRTEITPMLSLVTPTARYDAT